MGKKLTLGQELSKQCNQFNPYGVDVYSFNLKNEMKISPPPQMMSGQCILTSTHQYVILLHVEHSCMTEHMATIM